MNTAIAEARATGTGLVGDISNTLSSVPPLMAERCSAVVFHELIGFRNDRASAEVEAARLRLVSLTPGNEVRLALAAHAPYSVSPSLFREIRKTLDGAPSGRCSVHLGESAAEIEFLRHGTGPWRALLEDLGSWDSTWQPPGCDPVEYLDRLAFLDQRTLVVHGVQFGERDLTRLAGLGGTLVTCPRGNQRTGAGTPPVDAFYESGVPVAIGTDSLASVPDLNLFSELAELRRLAPGVPAARLIESATLTGARALGFESDYGSIDAGKRASFTAVALPEPVADVAEYLVHGIGPSEISHLNGFDAE